MSDNNGNGGFSGGQILLAFLGGALAGAAFAYFNAPRPGQESREKLKERADEVRETTQRVPQALRDAALAAREAFTESVRGA